MGRGSLVSERCALQRRGSKRILMSSSRITDMNRTPRRFAGVLEDAVLVLAAVYALPLAIVAIGTPFVIVFVWLPRWVRAIMSP